MREATSTVLAEYRLDKGNLRRYDLKEARAHTHDVHTRTAYE